MDRWALREFASGGGWIFHWGQVPIIRLTCRHDRVPQQNDPASTDPLDTAGNFSYTLPILEVPFSLFLIAGSGRYPRLVAEAARRDGVQKIMMAGFEGETDAATLELADAVTLMRVGQLGRLLDAARASGAAHGIMAGQLAPNNLFNLRPDLKALVLLARIRERNAETLFGAVADALASAGVSLLPATRFLEDQLASPGHIGGPVLKKRDVADAEFGMRIAKETSRLDIGQTIVVKNGTVLAVEAFEGTNDAITRGGKLGRGGGLVVKVSKPGQDMRFDVPVIGERTLEIAAAAGIRGIVAEAGRVLLLDKHSLCNQANHLRITLHGIQS